MAEQIEKEMVTCPTCGQSAVPDQKCCGCIDENTACPEGLAEVITHEGERVPLKTRWTRIGRDPGNDLVLNDDGFASRYHAWITYESGDFWVEDLGSTNGTVLNGQPLSERKVLSAGDKIKIGDSEITFLHLDKTG